MGVDLVKYQILIALGEQIRESQSDFLTPKKYAIECRINAEDPFGEFRPSPGKISMYYAPGGKDVRVDSHAYAGYTIPPYYDSLISKLIVTGKDRREAMDRMSRALGELHDRRHQDDHPLPAGDPPGSQFPPRHVFHEFCGESSRRRAT